MEQPATESAEEFVTVFGKRMKIVRNAMSKTHHISLSRLPFYCEAMGNNEERWCNWQLWYNNGVLKSGSATTFKQAALAIDEAADEATRDIAYFLERAR